MQIQSAQRIDKYLLEMADRAALIVFAYGLPHKSLRYRGPEVAELLSRGGTRPLHALKLCNDGTPSHPLYLKGDLKPTLWIAGTETSESGRSMPSDLIPEWLPRRTMLTRRCLLLLALLLAFAFAVYETPTSAPIGKSISPGDLSESVKRGLNRNYFSHSGSPLAPR